MPTIDELRQAMAEQQGIEAPAEEAQDSDTLTMDPCTALSDKVMQETEELYDAILALVVREEDGIAISKGIADALNMATLVVYLAGLNEGAKLSNTYLRQIGYKPRRDHSSVDTTNMGLPEKSPLAAMRRQAMLQAFQDSYCMSYEDAKKEQADFDVKAFIGKGESEGVLELMDEAEGVIRNAKAIDQAKTAALMDLYQDLCRRAALDWLVAGFDEGWHKAVEVMEEPHG